MLALALVGCSSDGSLVDYAMEGGSATTSAPPEDEDVSEAFPAWYAIEAVLVVAEGAPSAAGSSVTVEVVDDTRSEVLCSAEVAATSIIASSDGPLGVWWELDLADLDLCASPPPLEGVGIGELVPDVRARLGAVGLDEVADSVFGAWLQEEGGPPLSFGYAATDTDLTGDDVAELPPPDGSYSVRTLLLSALPVE